LSHSGFFLVYAVSTPDKEGDTAVTYVLTSATALYI